MSLVKDIFCFYNPLEKSHRPSLDLLELWAATWRKHGWEPHVLSMSEAVAHPKCAQMMVKIMRLPTQNNKHWENSCYLRWLAFAQFSGVMTDYDVLPQKPFPPFESKGFWNGQAPVGFIAGEPLDFEKIVDAILDYEVRSDDLYQNRPHVSDMTILSRNLDLFTCLDRVALCYGNEGWKRMPLVHFSNATLKRPVAEKVAEIKEILGL